MSRGARSREHAQVRSRVERYGDKATREVVRALRRHGCSIDRTASGHVLITHPSGARLTLSGTPRSGAPWDLVRSWLRRAADGQRLVQRSGRDPAGPGAAGAPSPTPALTGKR